MRKLGEFNLSTFHERLNEAVKAAGKLSQSELARRTSLAQGTVRSYLIGESFPGIDKLDVLAMALNVRPEWLATGEEPMQAGTKALVPASAAQLATLDGYCLIPRQDVMASAGGAILLSAEDIVDYVLFKEDFLRRELGVDPKNVRVIQAKGDSMEPTIRSGDLLLLDLSQALDTDNAVYVLNVNGRVMVKRLQFKFDGTVKVLSDNPKYEPETVQPSSVELFRLVGRVVWSGGQM